MISLKAKAVLLLVTLLTLGVTLCAQTSTGEVNGTVTDQNGAAVSGATVKLINQATRTRETPCAGLPCTTWICLYSRAFR